MHLRHTHARLYAMPNYGSQHTDIIYLLSTCTYTVKCPCTHTHVIVLRSIVLFLDNKYFLTLNDSLYFEIIHSER